MSVIWQLPEDILHSIYSEWLEWKDLSMLDIACVEKNEREEWLTSLSDLKMSGELEDDRLWGDKMTMFYKWVGSRKVYFVERFPLRLDVLDDLAAALDLKSYCPTLRSIVIERGGGFHLPGRSELDSILSMFFSHCHNLRHVTVVCIEDESLLYEVLIEIVLGALEEDLRENSLIKLSLKGPHTYHQNQDVIARLLIKHASSLEELNVCMSDGMELIISTLLEFGIHLRGLNVHVGMTPLETTESWLMPYLSSSAGSFLESLKVECCGTSFNLGDFLVSLASLCPKLTSLAIRNTFPSSTESLYRLLTQCPHLRNVSINGPISTNDKTSTMCVEVRSHDEVWLPCLSYALARSRPKRVILDLTDHDYRPVASLKSLLAPYQIELESCAPEASLTALLRDLPHLNNLLLEQDVDNVYSDATLSAITEHANSLTRFDVYFSDLDAFQFSDTCWREMIERCQMLDRISVPCCGLDSLMALSRHSNLRVIEVTMDQSVSDEILDEVLLDEEVRWPSSLEEGSVDLYEYGIKYEFNEESRHWMKDEGN
eukprot:scaffold4164_cov190-Ochromonas_danica.AAC.1